MRRLLRTWLIALAGTMLGAAPGLGQERIRPASHDGLIMQSVSVPVYPGQLLVATVALPTLEETPLPAVLLLVVREPDSAPVAAAVAMSDALLARGIAVVQLEVPPVAADDEGRAEPLTQPADDAFAVLQFMREREDMDGDRIGLVGVGAAARHAARAAALDEAVRAVVLIGAGEAPRDSIDLPTGLPLMALPLETRAAPSGPTPPASPVLDGAAFLSRHLQNN